MNGPPTVAGDADVVRQSLEQPEIFARRYDRYAPDIHRYAARRLGDGSADDITAETFLIAFRTRARYDTARGNARPWLYGIAANLIGKQRRTEARALRALARTGTDPVAESWTDRADSRVAAEAAQGPARRRPRRALTKIPGVGVAGHRVKDAMGREAVAVTFTDPEAGAMGGRMRYELLLDPATYDQLGTRWVAAETFSSKLTDNREVSEGDALSSTADISKVVDKPGQTA